jgi:ATP-dependent helicase/nuclease subunit A
MKKTSSLLINERLMASAGSGKTYALTNRYISILLRQPEPHKIIAMTFTRKAAGEFFQKTFIKLATACSSEKNANELSRELEVSANRSDYLQLLRQMVEHLPQLHLSTYDGFFIYLARCFYPELGLPGSPEILPPEERDITQDSIIEDIVTRKSLSPEQKQSFLQMLQHLHSGKGIIPSLESLRNLVNQSLPLFHQFPDTASWGNAEYLLSKYPHWVPFVNHPDSPEAFQQAKEDYLTQLHASELERSIATPLEKFAEELSSLYHTGTGSNSKLAQEILPKAHLIVSKGICTVAYGKKGYELGRNLCTPLAQMLLPTIGRYLKNLFLRTRAVALFLANYQDASERVNYSTGKFTYQDITRLLMPSDSGSPLGRDQDKQLLYYRMDSRLDHWLLDEFQDTSVDQWRVIEPLIDEVVQDNEKRRSFFYVGDVKQALYLWRGSSNSLFQDVFERYSPEIKDGKALNVSWRSRVEIIDTINKIFGGDDALKESLPRDVYNRWIQSWSDHKPAPHLQEKGQAYAQLKSITEISEDHPDGLPFEISRLLKEIDPLQRDLTVAIILRSNKQVQEVANYLRAHTAFPVSVESNQTPFTDNIAGILIQCWLRCCLHPDETACESMLQLYQPDIASTKDLLVAQLQHLQEIWFSRGAEAAVLSLIPGVLQSLSKQGEIDALCQVRARQCREAAAIFDKKGIHDQDQLLDFIRHYQVIDNGSPHSIQVTTIHKSKGLDYDIVITLADNTPFQSKTGRATFVSSHSSDAKSSWVCEQVPETWKFLFPCIEEQSEKNLHARAYGELCALYVATTRAKRGLYMFVDCKNDSPSPANLLIKSLKQEREAPPSSDGILYACGDPQWYEQSPLRSSSAPAKEKSSQVQHSFPLTSVRLQQFVPSHSSTDKTFGRWYFSSHTAEQRDMGTIIHRLFESVEWLPDDTSTWHAILQPHRGMIPDQTFHQLLSYIQQPDWISLFVRPHAVNCALWREKEFSVILNDQWIHGVLDRVIITYDVSGKPSRAHLIDFKTDKVDSQKDLLKRVEHHRSQLQIYQNALRKLLRTDHIRATLAFLSSGQLVDID